MNEKPETPNEYLVYLSAFVAHLAGESYGSVGTDERRAVASVLGAADGTQARQMAGQPGQVSPDTYIRGKADVSREIDRRLGEARPRA